VARDGYRVPSQAGPGIYRVSLRPGTEHCTCPDYTHHGHHNNREPGTFFCKHLYAALLWAIKTGIHHDMIPDGDTQETRTPAPLEKAS
jgi:hypothetical protein